MTTAHTKRIFGALLAFAMFIGLSVTGTVALADDNSTGLNGCDATVVVKESINLSGDITLNKGCSIERATGFTGPIFTIKDATVTITGNGATIDGKGVSADAPLIVVDGATLTLNGVTITGGLNNSTQVVGAAMTDESWISKGGAIGARRSTVNLNKTIIKKNTATLGGGLFADGSTVNVNSGTTFSANQAVSEKSTFFAASKYAAGAGLFATSVNGNSVITVNEGAKFVENGSAGNPEHDLSAGGAIATGRIVKKKDGSQGLDEANATYAMNAAGKTMLNIKGGDFKNNKAGLAGGAIFVQRTDVAVVIGGNFDSNHADGHGLVQNFSGGAIYVEGPGKGPGHDWEVGSVGEGLPGGALYLKNALITGNTAGQAGGGIGLCDTGDGFVGYTDGAAVYGNKALTNTEGNDIHISRAGGAPSTTTLSRKALGGANNQWVGKDGAGNDIDPYYVAPGGHKYRWFTNQLTADQVPDSVVKVRFTNNSTGQWGGAIAVNGDLVIGEQVGAFYLKKVDSKTGDALGGAEFRLTGPRGYDVTVATQASGANAGEAAFRDLLPGAYRLVETKAPNGYANLNLEWKVVVADATHDYAVTVSNAQGDEIVPEGTREDTAGNVYNVYKLENVAPEIGTVASDANDADDTLVLNDRSETASVKDVVAYRGLEAGKLYTVKGKLVNKANGETVATTSATFTAATAGIGLADVTFTFDVTSFKNDGVTQLVAFEYVFKGDVTAEDIDLDNADSHEDFVAKHEDIDDEAQTVNVTYTKDAELPPVIGTTATDNADSDKTVAAGKVDVKDVVTYENLAPGIYTVKGKLVVKGTDGKDIVAEAQATFEATGENGTVELIFSADTAQLAGKELVAYEYLFAGDVTAENVDLDKAEGDARFVTKHADDNDAAQTVKVEEKKPTPSPTKSVKLPVTGLPQTGATVGMTALVMALLISGGVFLLRRRQA